MLLLLFRTLLQSFWQRNAGYRVGARLRRPAKKGWKVRGRDNLVHLLAATVFNWWCLIVVNQVALYNRSNVIVWLSLKLFITNFVTISECKTPEFAA